MFGKKPKKNPQLDPVVDRILADMEMYGPDSPEYAQLLEHLERAYNLRKTNDAKKVSPDTVVLVAGQLGIALIMVAYEQKHVITSKALGLIGSLKTK